MICEGYPAEVYGMYVLRLLEDAATAEISRHLESDCETCRQEVRASVALWYLVGLVQTADSSARPSPQLRSRILQIAQSEPARGWWFRPPVLGWAQTLAASIVIAGAVWYGLRTDRERRVGGKAGEEKAPVAQSQSNEAQWRDRAEKAERELEALRAATPPVVSKAPAPAATPDGSRALADALSANRTLADSLQQERTRASALETELASERQALAAVQQQKDDAEKRAGAVGEALAQVKAREERIAGLTTRVQQLERENTTFRDTVTRLERQFDRSSRLVAFLSSPSVKMVQLQGTEAGAKALGHAFIVEGQKLVFYAANLPPLAPGRTYQLWVLRGKGPAIVSGGVARPDAAQRLTIEFENPALLGEIRGLAVTEEPNGGSPGPTGHKILVGTVRS